MALSWLPTVERRINGTISRAFCRTSLERSSGSAIAPSQQYGWAFLAAGNIAGHMVNCQGTISTGTTTREVAVGGS
jgi:hypothetical protein